MINIHLRLKPAQHSKFLHPYEMEFLQTTSKKPMMKLLNLNMNVPNVKIKIKSIGENPKFLNVE